MTSCTTNPHGPVTSSPRRTGYVLNGEVADDTSGAAPVTSLVFDTADLLTITAIDVATG